MAVWKTCGLWLRIYAVLTKPHLLSSFVKWVKDLLRKAVVRIRLLVGVTAQNMSFSSTLPLRGKAAWAKYLGTGNLVIRYSNSVLANRFVRDLVLQCCGRKAKNGSD